MTKVPTTAPDFGGAIGVDNDGNVNGVDITMPVMHFSETHFFKASCVTTTFKKRLAGLTGTINKSAFRGFQAGEVLFLGAAGTRRGTDSEDEWEITYRFAVSLVAVCSDSVGHCFFLSFRNVFPRLHRRPDHNLVVSRLTEDNYV